MVADILNKELGYEFTESKYRKSFNAFEKIFNANKNKFIQDDNYIKEIKAQQDLLYKVKRQVSDQRREYNKLLVSDARADNLTEKLIEAANKINEQKPLDFTKCFTEYSKDEGLLILADWHWGMVVDNIWNSYNIEIARSRIEQLFYKTIQNIKLHNIKKLHVALLGDFSHGSIHTSCRVASEEDTCDQLMQVSEVLAELLSRLSKYVDEIDVYSTYGNHMRTIQDKKDSIHSDNMEKIMPWWLRQRFQNEDSIHIIDSEYYEFILIDILGYYICGSHGDLDNVKQSALTISTLFNKKFNKNIDYIISGDKHHIEEFERLGIESTLIRSLCGSDDYANDHRLYANAGQTLMIFEENEGKLCTYNMKLD